MPEISLEEMATMPFTRLRKWVREAVDVYTDDERQVSGRRIKQLTAGVLDELDRLKGDPRTWNDPTPEAVFRKAFAKIS